MFIEDDKKLKIIIYTMISISAVIIIGVWESFIKPIFRFLTENINIF